MISAWTRWRISTAIEKGKPLSPALARKVSRDRECRQFYEASLAMAVRLRRDAADVVQVEQERLDAADRAELPLLAARRSSRPARSRKPALAAATAVLIALALGAGVWWWRSTPPTPSTPSVPDARRPSAPQESDVAELAQLIRQIGTNVGRAAEQKGPRWQQIMDRSRDAIETPLKREAENMAADTRGILQALSSIIQPDDDPEPSDPAEDAPPSSSSGRRTPPLPASNSLAYGPLAVGISP